MRQTINMLKDEALMKNELLAKYERQNQKMQEEVSRSDSRAHFTGSRMQS
jgi:hypothetical protein